MNDENWSSYLKLNYDPNSSNYLNCSYDSDFNLKKTLLLSFSFDFFVAKLQHTNLPPIPEAKNKLDGKSGERLQEELKFIEMSNGSFLQ